MDNLEGERDKLRAVQAVFENAVKNNTIEDLRSYCDPDFSFVSFTDRAFSDFDSFCKQWNLTRSEMIGNGSFETKLDPEPSLFIDDVAVCHGNSKNNMVDKNGKNFSFTSNWTVVFKRQDGEWKVLRAHNSLNPFSNPMLVDAVKSKITLSSIIAFVLGGAICSLILYSILG